MLECILIIQGTPLIGWILIIWYSLNFKKIIKYENKTKYANKNKTNNIWEQI